MNLFFLLFPFLEFIKPVLINKLKNYFSNLTLLKKLSYLFDTKLIPIKSKLLILYAFLLDMYDLLPYQINWIILKIIQGYWVKILSIPLIKWISDFLKSVLPEYYVKNSKFLIIGLSQYLDSSIEPGGLTQLFIFNTGLIFINAFKLYLLIVAVIRIIFILDEKLYNKKFSSYVNKHYYHTSLFYKFGMCFIYIFKTNYILYYVFLRSFYSVCLIRLKHHYIG